MSSSVYYSIDDAHGTLIATGIAADRIARLAQEVADERGEVVLYYNNDETAGVKVYPSVVEV